MGAVIRVAVVVHSERGTTRALAEAVAAGARAGGAEAAVMDVGAIDWDRLAAADAIVFGCPTYMGSASGRFKAFLDDSSARAWVSGAWRDKVAAGFTGSASPSGDKLATLQQLAIVAAQHGMVWVGLDLLPGSGPDALNRLGSSLGAMAHVPVGAAPSTADVATARHLGRRVATAAARWSAGRPQPATGVHPASQDWVLPPDERPALPGLERVNLRAMMSRPERFEHHLVVVARVGQAQLEVVTASEPLAFAHVNRTDEYAVALPTGDPRLAAIPFLTLFTDPATGVDVARVRHGEGDLVLHPVGWAHWPGRLRPPYAPFPFPAGMRRCGLSLVLCGAEALGPGLRPIPASGEIKRYAEVALGLGVADVLRGPPGPVAEVAGAVLSVATGRVAPPAGGWVVVLEPDAGGTLFPGDLVRLWPGAALDVGRALVLAGEVPPDPPPPSWDRLPAPPFAPAEHGPAGSLPFELGPAFPLGRSGPLRFEAVDDTTVRVVAGEQAAEVPRRWAARMLFRVGLHGLRLGHLETYGGLFWDDRGGYRIGLRGGDGVQAAVEIPERAVLGVVEALYRAIAPPGHQERLDG